MISDPSSASVYTDFQGLMQLKAEAGKQTPEAIRETARQFEALFMQIMLKSMREASPGDGMFDSEQVGFYRELYDRQIALELVKGQGLGIADLLATRLGLEDRPQGADAVTAGGLATAKAQIVEAESAVPVTAGLQTGPGPLISINSTHPVQPLIDVSDTPLIPLAGHSNNDWRPETPEAFIDELWPHASEGAARLGVRPDVLVAQAALETGWGQKMIRHPDGRNSFNLFGIKADARWEGDRVTVPTLEYQDGVASRQRAVFRSYDSLTAAVTDYVDFLHANPRYRPALAQASDPEAFLQGLRDAGYATDPDYAEKITAIMNRTSLGGDRVELKSSVPLPLING